MNKVTSILSAAQRGDPRAAEQLLPLVYDELRKLAAQRMANEPPGLTLQPTALVHEAYLRLVGRDGDGAGTPRWNSRGHFFAAAAEAMRRILIEAARRRSRQKRGGGVGGGGAWERTEVDAIAAPDPDEELLALDEALKKLALTDPIKARLVELRYFAGLTGEQAADVLEISRTTANRHWSYARAWLKAATQGG